MVSLIFVTYAYSGWNAAAYVAGEIVDPGRTIPRAMIGGTLFVGLLYLVVNGIYLYALPVTELGQPPILPVANKVAAAMLGPAGTLLVTALLCLSIAGAVSAMVWAGPRVYYAMAQDGLIPSFFSKTPGRQHADQCHPSAEPMGVSPDSFGELRAAGDLQRHRVTIFSALAVGAIPILRRQEPTLPRPYRTPLYPFVPAFYLLVSTVIVGTALYERPVEGGLGIATVLAGTPLTYSGIGCMVPRIGIRDSLRRSAASLPLDVHERL